MKKQHNLIFVGDERLKKKAKPVQKITRATKRLVKEMLKIMREKRGVGLAAPQVGELERIIVLDIPLEDGHEDPIILINPEIHSKSDQIEIMDEACLSVPSKMGKVPRNTKVKVRGLSIDGESVEIEGEGLLSQALQHEIDHLDGILYIDRAILVNEVDSQGHIKEPQGAN